MRGFWAAVVTLFLLSGCSPGQEGQHLSTAQIVIDTKRGPQSFTVEMATNDAQREKGLMFRKDLPPDAGMLFDFQKEGYRSFWMKNTPLPLDMLFIRKNGTISTIAENTVPYSEDPVASSEPVRAVLEINGGRAEALGIQPGDKVHAKIFGNAP